MDYSGTTGWQVRSIKFEGNEVVIIFKDLKTPFHWEWKVKDKPTFRTAGQSRTLYQMQLKLVEDFTLKSKLKSRYREEYYIQLQNPTKINKI